MNTNYSWKPWADSTLEELDVEGGKYKSWS